MVFKFRMRLVFPKTKGHLAIIYYFISYWFIWGESGRRTSFQPSGHYPWSYVNMAYLVLLKWFQWLTAQSPQSTVSLCFRRDQNSNSTALSSLDKQFYTTWMQNGGLFPCLGKRLFSDIFWKLFKWIKIFDKFLFFFWSVCFQSGFYIRRTERWLKAKIFSIDIKENIKSF